jgi:hypothetical protein
MYENPKNIFEQKIKSILNREAKSLDLFEDIFKLQQILSFEKLKAGTPREDSDQWKTLLEVYTTLGSTQFTKLISIINGKTLSFPSISDYQESIVSALSYYYKEILGLEWKEIKEKLSLADHDSIKYGIRIRQLRSFIDEQMLKKLGMKDKK